MVLEKLRMEQLYNTFSKKPLLWDPPRENYKEKKVNLGKISREILFSINTIWLSLANKIYYSPRGGVIPSEYNVVL